MAERSELATFAESCRERGLSYLQGSAGDGARVLKDASKRRAVIHEAKLFQRGGRQNAAGPWPLAVPWFVAAVVIAASAIDVAAVTAGVRSSTV
jgi:hypothetical protein